MVTTVPVVEHAVGTMAVVLFPAAMATVYGPDPLTEAGLIRKGLATVATVEPPEEVTM